MVDKSAGCWFAAHLDIWTAAKLVRAYDEQVAKDPSFAVSKVIPKVLQMYAVFHESRVGSTMLSNAFVAASPKKHRSFSETPPPSTAMGTCRRRNRDFLGPSESYDRTNINHICRRPDQAPAVLRDVMYLQARSSNPKEERAMFKFQTAPNIYIPIFQKAFPDVPWVFLFREPVQVLMSYATDDAKLEKQWCATGRDHPSLEIKEWAAQHGVEDPGKTLSLLEYCALVISSATQAGLENLVGQPKPHKGIAIDYKDLKLPSTIEALFVEHFGIQLSKQEVENIKVSLGSYSKAGYGKKDWHGDDSKTKEKAASEEVKNAANQWLKDSYEKLSQLSSYKSS
jgi:hypothetical protein